MTDDECATIVACAKLDGQEDRRLGVRRLGFDDVTAMRYMGTNGESRQNLTSRVRNLYRTCYREGWLHENRFGKTAPTE